MIIVEVWKSNRPRSNGKFNRRFWWMYPFVLPFFLVWDVLQWLEDLP